MSYTAIRILQILVCIVIAMPGIFLVLHANTTAARVVTAGLTLLGLYFSWDIGYLIYKFLYMLITAVFMLCAYIFFILLAVVFALMPLLIVAKWLMRR